MQAPIDFTLILLVSVQAQSFPNHVDPLGGVNLCFYTALSQIPASFSSSNRVPTRRSS